MQFSILYKKVAKGALLSWRVWTEGSEVHVEYGHVGGSMQHTYSVATPKNLGRTNETTGEQQAEREAQSQWEEKRIRDRYVDDMDRARNGETDQKGGRELMLAHPYPKHRKKMRFPAYEQPKLDGVRCYSDIQVDGKTLLWSRKQEPILTVPHIVEALSALRVSTALPLDGELYCHGMPFQQILSIVKRGGTHPDFEKIEYHVYDTVSDAPFSDRIEILRRLAPQFGGPLRLVETRRVESEEQAYLVFSEFLAARYEGGMIRSADGGYEAGRSSRLLKLKEFEDHEYEVVGITEGNGRLMGHVGAFSCVTHSGNPFEVKMSGETSVLRSMFLDSSKWRGRYMKVRHQGFTGSNVPRFPVGLGLIDPEDAGESPEPDTGAKS